MELRRLQCRVHYYVADGTVLSRLPADWAPASRRPEAITIPANEAQNYDGERKCSEVRIRAERQAGILLIEMKQNGRRERQGGDLKSKSRGTALMDLGISRDQFRSGIGTAALVWPSDL